MKLLSSCPSSALSILFSFFNFVFVTFLLLLLLFLLLFLFLSLVEVPGYEIEIVSSYCFSSYDNASFLGIHMSSSVS